jgi:hypothetical protein
VDDAYGTAAASILARQLLPIAFTVDCGSDT